MLVVGGMSNVWGAVLGSALVKLLQDQLQVFLPSLLGSSGNFEVIVFVLLLILLLRFASDGLWPFIARLIPRAPPRALTAHPSCRGARRPGRANLCSRFGTCASSSVAWLPWDGVGLDVKPAKSSA